MTRRRITLALLVATTLFALALPPLVGSQGQRRANRIDRCADNGGRTLVASRSIRVYLKRDRLGNEYLRYCWVPSGATATLRSSGGRVRDVVPEYRIAGRYLGSTFISVDTGQPPEPGVFLTVGVTDVKRDRCVAGLDAQPPGSGTPLQYTDSRPGVTDLEISAAGAIAWVVSGWPNRDDYFYVQKADGAVDGQVVLDEGPAIDPRSLAIAGRRIFWMNGTQARSAVLVGRARDPDCR